MREGGLMQMGREGSRQSPLPRSSFYIALEFVTCE